uniref:Beta-glucosidase n=1 Tax=Delphinium grandiflorum TaxID=85439 RepID=U6C515_DELGR|nr:hypothetical protein [Delphinium grandiflorum]
MAVCSSFPSMVMHCKQSPPLLHTNLKNNLVVKKVRVPSCNNKVSRVKCAMEYDVTRSDFPSDFVFGASSSALQIEGASTQYGKTPSIWDHYTEKYPDNIVNRANIKVACDSYHKYKEDIKMLKAMGATSYRFSIAWTRILPNGNLKGGINRKGIEHYKKILDELHENGIEPFVTLLHFDSPQVLESRYKGLVSPDFVDDFKDFCDVCFEHFGGKVKHWITINEPSLASEFGYSTGKFAPGRCSNREICEEGDSAREPYLVAHHMILAHATAAQLYRRKYKHQGGELGIAFVCSWFLPYSDSPKDIQAFERARDFNLGWFMDPFVYGDYPFVMRKLVGERLPTFTKEEKKMVKGSLDFVGINYYYSKYVEHVDNHHTEPIDWATDTHVKLQSVNARGEELNEIKDENLMFTTYPDGLRQVLVYLTQRYDNPKIYITENGNGHKAEKITDYKSLVAYVEDYYRIQYIKGHLAAIKRAREEGADVRGYFVWSLMDSFEFRNGYSIRFGLWYTDYLHHKLQRLPKQSGSWYSSFLRVKQPLLVDA